jgi:hypothetical protein
VKAFVHKFLCSIERHSDSLLGAAGVWFWAAFIAMFLEKRLPALRPLVLWTFRIYFGGFVAGLIALMVVAPGVVVTNELSFSVLDPKSSKSEQRFTRVWCAGAGFLFTVLIGAAYVLQSSGMVSDIKVWFVALLWTTLMIPYGLLGYVIRRSIRKSRKLI